MNFRHQFSSYALKEYDWFLPDLEKSYESNLSHNYIELAKNNWISYVKFTYKFNEIGFRSQSVYENNILVLGCSYTFGIGIPYDKIWAYLIAEKIGLNLLNFGIPGCSPYSAFRIGWHTLKYLKPKMVIFLTPFNDRMPVIGKHLMYDIGPWYFKSNMTTHYTYFNKTAVEYYKEYVLNEENLILSCEMAKLSMEQLCSNNNIKYINLSVTDLELIDFGRDLAHPGIKSHEMFACKILNLM